MRRHALTLGPAWPRGGLPLRLHPGRPVRKNHGEFIYQPSLLLLSSSRRLRSTHGCDKGASAFGSPTMTYLKPCCDMADTSSLAGSM